MNNIKQIALFLLFSGSLLSSMGQQAKIMGRVFDARNNEPIPFANIIISGTTIGSTSDIDGNFVFTGVKPGFVKLTVSAVGYDLKISDELQLTTARTAYVDIPMNPAQVQLEEVFLEAT